MRSTEPPAVVVPSSGWLLRERARPERVRNFPQAWKLAVATVCFGAFMGQLDASIVTLTYRPLESEFHAGLASVQWVSLMYLLTLIASLVPIGRLSDTRGRKLLYLYGFVIFTVASAACGLAPNLAFLIGMRTVQALGAALLQANSVALVTTSSPRARRRDALGAQAAAQALGLALGPTLGGVVVSTMGWRWVYFINVPVGLFAVIAGHYLLPRTRERSHAFAVDRPSVAMLAVATTGLLVGMSAASGLRAPSELTVGAFVLSLTAGWRFVVRQRKAPCPLVDLELLHDRAVSWGLGAAMFGYLVLFGPLVLVPVVLVAQRTSAVVVGLVLTALPAGFAVAALGTPTVLPSVLTERRRATLGALIATVALSVGLAVDLTPLSLLPLLALTGIGLGVFTPSNNSMIMGATPRHAAATGGGLLNLSRGLGTALGVASVTLAVHVGAGHLRSIGGDHLAVIVLVASAALATLASVGGSQGQRRAPPI